MTKAYAYVAVTNDLNQDQRMHRICNTMREQGFHVTLIGRKKSGSEDLYKQKFEQHRLELFFSNGFLFYLEYQIRLFFYLMFAKSPKVIVSVDLDTALPVRLVGRIKNLKTIHDAHEWFTEVPELKKSPFKRWIWKMVGKLTVYAFDHRITVNQSLAQALKEEYNCDFIVVKNLPQAKEESLALISNDRPYIWYQGVLNEGRGLEELIVAMEDFPDLDLRVAGEGDRSMALRSMAEASSASDRIYFHGWLQPLELHDWASNAWLGVNLLNKNSDNYYYSLANRTFDFVQAKLPALHMDFPEYKQLIEEYKVGMLLSELSASEIVSAIRMLREDEALYEELQIECERAKAKLVWSLESEKIIEILAAE